MSLSSLSPDIQVELERALDRLCRTTRSILSPSTAYPDTLTNAERLLARIDDLRTADMSATSAVS